MTRRDIIVGQRRVHELEARDDDLNEMQLLEELEDFAPDDMAKLLRYFKLKVRPNHP